MMNISNMYGYGLQPMAYNTQLAYGPIYSQLQLQPTPQPLILSLQELVAVPTRTDAGDKLYRAAYDK